MIELEGIDPAKVRFVPIGIPDRAAGQRPRACARRSGSRTTRWSSGRCAGSARRRRSTSRSTRWRDCAPDYPDLRFVVVGDGPDRSRLERQASRLLGDRALFAGQRPNSEIPGLVAAMDVLVCSSDFEGTPAAVLEWMAAGKPIVATAVGGIPAIIEDGVGGLLVPPRAPDALAGAIRQLLDDPGLRQRLGAAARQRQQADFRLARTVEILEDLYETLYWDSPHGRRELATGSAR